MPPFLYHFQHQVPSLSLQADQRFLIEFVSHSPHVAAEVRQRAQILLLLDKGENLERITQATAASKQAVRSLITEHGQHGVRAALLGRRSSAKGFAQKVAA